MIINIKIIRKKELILYGKHVKINIIRIRTRIKFRTVFTILKIIFPIINNNYNILTIINSYDNIIEAVTI